MSDFPPLPSMIELDLELLEVVKEKFYNHHPSMLVNTKSFSAPEEYQNSKTIYLSTYAGPQSHLSNLFHEMAHFVEIDQKRMTLANSGWGFSYGKYWRILNSSGYECSTMASTLREMRVWAYQINLLKHFNIFTDIQDLTSAADFINSFMFVPGKNKEERHNWIETEVEKMSREVRYSFDAFSMEWERRCKILDKRLERHNIKNKKVRFPDMR